MHMPLDDCSDVVIGPVFVEMEKYMRHNLKTMIAVLFAALLLGGCAELNSIYRANTLPTNAPHIVSIDAKQRVVLSNPNMAQGQATSKAPLMRFCAEPPPDVFTALASSLGAEASVSKSSSMDAAVRLAATLSENAATVERTQTVNILREAMYRNCERYLSGAISEEEFIVQAARDQQLIVQVLAVEQITGVARSQSSALTTVAKSASGGVSDASLATLTEAKKDLDTKRAISKKENNEAAALPPTGACGTSPIDIDKLPSGVTSEQAKEKNAKCAEASKAAEIAKEAQEYFELVKKTVAKQGVANSETQGKLASVALTASEASIEIAQKVVEIVRLYQAFDEIGMSCIVKLRTETDPKKYEFCQDLLEQIAKTRTAQLGLEEERINAERVKIFRTHMDTASQDMAELVWKKLGRNFSPSKLKGLADKAVVILSDAHKQRLEAAKSDLQAFVRAFKKLPQGQQRKLSDAALQP